MTFVLYVLGGIASGILGGMGMGGGTILIPVLTLFFNEPQHLAQALNLLSFIPMAVISLIIHFKNGFIKYKNILFAILPGLITCVCASYLAKQIDGSLLKKFFGGFLVALSILQIICFIIFIKTKA